MMRPILFVLTFLPICFSERCPPVFGDFECPQRFFCKERQCFGENNITSSTCGTDIECLEGTVCVEGKCYPLATIKCNRHILTAEGQAHSIVSDCGKRGKCINGNCALDRCLGVSCMEGELCRGGECVRVVDSFCIGHADCGPTMECRNNKCFIKNLEPICNCQPQEICHHGQCFLNTQCTSMYCEQGSYCVEGHCVNAIGVDCHEDTCHGGTICVNGVCVVNPCPHRCPTDQDCRLGECRLMEGLPCIGECKGPYECVDGRCRRNDCLHRVCQLGESCEGGACVRVVGRFCTWAPRDCGYAFACHENKCVDLLTATPLAMQQGNQLL